MQIDSASYIVYCPDEFRAVNIMSELVLSLMEKIVRVQDMCKLTCIYMKNCNK